MKNIYFLDTSYIFALEIKNKDAHQKVLQNWTNFFLRALLFETLRERAFAVQS